VDPEFDFYYRLKLCSVLIIFVDSRLNTVANGRFNIVEEHIEERFALNLPYFPLIVVGDACRAGHLLIDEDVLGLDGQGLGEGFITLGFIVC
jgi:hypothetical protein